MKRVKWDSVGRRALKPDTALADWAKKKDISPRRARVLAEAGRIKGAKLIGGSWIVPAGSGYTRKPAGRPKGA